MLMLLLLCIQVCSGLYINRAFQTVTSWTHLADFCFLPRGGYVEYRVQSHVPVPVLLYHRQSKGNTSQQADSVVDSTTESGSSLMGTIAHTDDAIRNHTAHSQRYTTASIIADDHDGYETLESAMERDQEPCGESSLKLFRSIEAMGSGKLKVASDHEEVMCLSVALSPHCHQTLSDFKLELTITNKVQTFWWRHVSADDVSLFLADLTGFGFVLMLAFAALCVRIYLTSHKFYVHAINSCILSMLLLLLVLGVNILLHGLFCVDGYDVGHVEVIIKVIYISAQALFIQAIFLDTLKHVWCNEERKLEQGYAISLIISALTLFYGLAQVTIHGYQVFSNDVIYAQYAHFSLQGLMWIIFVFMVLCTVGSADPKEKNLQQNHPTNSLARYNRQGPPQPQLRSLFGDYDYAINLPAVMEHQALQNAAAQDDDTATNYTDFDHVVTPTPPETVGARWIGIDVSGHYTDDTSAVALGGCAVLMYSCWFLAVPLLTLWSPYLLPPWLTDQCIHAFGLLNFVIGYIYFLASCAPPQEDVRKESVQQTRQTVEHLTVI